ncbi:hypothetical protein SAMN02910371_00804 [Butyrivibrio sp. INlla14]|nr:hypothetical protein SAMN02910371_00804 [Butyrivibrio sp. INlla14]
MWQTPKTDWAWRSETEGDFFEYTDYNRIKGNIEYLKELAKEVYLPFSIIDMGNDKTRSDYPYADEINTLADNLEIIVENTYPVSIGTKTVYEDNGKFIGYADLNRIESATLNIYNNLNRIKAGKFRLSFRFGARRMRI